MIRRSQPIRQPAAQPAAGRGPHPHPALAAALPGSALLLAACGNAQGPHMLDTRGPGAGGIADLWWLMFWAGLGVFLVVFTLLLYAVFAARRREAGAAPPSISGERLLLWGGVVVPIPILTLVLGYTMYTGNAVSSRFPLGAGAEPAVTVDIIGHQFWWEVRYPEHGIVTANEIHIPAGEPVLFRITSADVIHSLWAPQLHGKLDLVPGETNTIRIQADEPGDYRGLCAEFCGRQHTYMHFLVIAQPADEFAAWVEQQQQPAAEPVEPLLRQGQQVFMGAGCVYCHAIGGLNVESATDIVGPDLTHVAGRRTLAAGILENNRGNLGGWILDPQALKPGNLMPPTRMDSGDFLALLAYLESLR